MEHERHALSMNGFLIDRGLEVVFDCNLPTPSLPGLSISFAVVLVGDGIVIASIGEVERETNKNDRQMGRITSTVKYE
jgi:hypothetical protein